MRATPRRLCLTILQFARWCEQVRPIDSDLPTDRSQPENGKRCDRRPVRRSQKLAGPLDCARKGCHRDHFGQNPLGIRQPPAIRSILFDKQTPLTIAPLDRWCSLITQQHTIHHLNAQRVLAIAAHRTHWPVVRRLQLPVTDHRPQRHSLTRCPLSCCHHKPLSMLGLLLNQLAIDDSLIAFPKLHPQQRRWPCLPRSLDRELPGFVERHSIDTPIAIQIQL